MDHVRSIATSLGGDPGNRAVEHLFGLDDGASHLDVRRIRTPTGRGSPEGLHTHVFDQVFLVLEGTMTIEIDGEQQQAGAGSVILFPAGVAHRNWNAGPDPTVHLAINAPAPVPGSPIAQPAHP